MSLTNLFMRTWKDWFIFREISAESGRVGSSATCQKYLNDNLLIFYQTADNLQWNLGQGSAYRQILHLRSRFPAYACKRLISCAILVSVECLVTRRSTHAQKPTFAANPCNTLAVSTEFPPSVSADSVLTVSRAKKLGPDQVLLRTLDHSFGICCHRILGIVALWTLIKTN